MRGLYCSSVDSLAGLSIRDLPDPVPDSGQVVVAASVASVDYADTLIATGRYQIKVPPPFVPGNNFAGVVTEIGAEVTSVAVAIVCTVWRWLELSPRRSSSINMPSARLRPGSATNWRA